MTSKRPSSPESATSVLATPTTRRTRGVHLTLALVVLTASLATSGCDPSRETPVLSCLGKQQCPANGLYYCDEDVGLCRACVGACPTTQIDATNDTADAASALPDAATAVADGGKADTSADATSLPDAATDTNADATDATDAAVDAKTLGSCVGHCGLAAEDCFCNAACTNAGNCCSDYGQVCLPDAATADAGALD